MAKIVAALLIVTSWSSASFAQQPEIKSELSRPQSFVGEMVRYNVFVQGTETPSDPILGQPDGYDIRDLGHKDVNNRSVTIVNGQVTERIEKGRIFRYAIIPRTEGTITIPPASADIDGKRLTSRSHTLRVIGISNQDYVKIELTAEPTAVYPMQDFQVRLTIAMRALPENLDNREPISVLRDPPQISIPWIDHEQVPDGLRSITNWSVTANELVSRRGFSIAEMPRDPLSAISIFRSSAEAYRPTPVKEKRTDPEGGMATFWLYHFDTTFRALEVGSKRLGPVGFKGLVATELNDRNDLIGEEIYTLSNELSINVKDVPTEGRPDSYIDAVGSFDVSSSISPTAAKLGDPMTLTLTVRGKGNLNNARAPELSQLPNIVDKFKLYEATERTEGNARVFRYSLRPLDESTTEFPSIPVSYFDVELEEYQTVATAPIPVTISRADVLSQNDIVSPDAPQNGPTLESSNGAIYANIAVAEARDNRITPKYYAFGLMLISSLYGAARFLTHRHHQQKLNPERQRRRNAYATVEKVIASAAQAAREGRHQDAIELIPVSFATLVSHLRNANVGALAARDITGHLSELFVSDTDVTRVAELLDDCGQAKYGAGESEAQELVARAENSLKNICNDLKDRGVLR